MNPKIMFVRVSENCNAGCFMCNFAHSHGLYNISIDQFNNLLESMEEKGTYEIIRFTGGEPLLHPNIVDFIEKASNQNYETSIITNGFLLPNLSTKLANSGLNQIIISIDGSKNEIHNKLRGLNGGLDRIKQGIKEIREINPNIVIRANTVVSDLNIDDLCDLYNMLDDLKFNSWSIIPIRPTNDPNTRWNEDNLKHNIEVYKKFISEQSKHPNLELLGYSKNWAGTTSEEICNTFTNKYRLVPKDKCNLVDVVRFYIPDKNLIVPCNCAAHRIEQIETEYNDEKDIYVKADLMADWLRENGPTNCTGCEPLNAYMADNTKILQKGLYKY